MANDFIKHTRDDMGDHWQIGPLNVILERDEQGWYAQSLEIDHYASGASEEEVHANFVHSLAETIHVNYMKFGNFAGVIVPAPEETWNKWREMHRVPTMKPGTKWAIPGAADPSVGFCNVMRAA
jgi:hypothetical protein